MKTIVKYGTQNGKADSAIVIYKEQMPWKCESGMINKKGDVFRSTSKDWYINRESLQLQMQISRESYICLR